ncbi:hypothetical protein WMY93_030553 [Mugilogobius chulae]|uniref:Tumor protein p53 inducible nuclear protein 1 n=1 Tax=Mugilogobius chulae TaxID=88201 RepID=A0AAW0MFM5_9GOBI
MFQRFTSALFGADTSELRPEATQSEEEDEDWILLNYLTDACSGSSSVCPEDDEDDEDDLVMLPSPTTPPALARCPSLTSLNSTTTEPDDLDSAAAADLDSDSDPDFLRVDPGELEESWFVTPPACFTRAQPLPLEPSPLENLLIEHPSMSVYLLPLHSNSKPRPPHGNRPRPQTGLQRAQGGAGKPGSSKKKEKRRSMDNRHRPEGIQRRPSSSCLSASVSGRVDLLQPRPPLALSRNALRRLNPQRPPKTATPQLHQPMQRHPQRPLKTATTSQRSASSTSDQPTVNSAPRRQPGRNCTSPPNASSTSDKPTAPSEGRSDTAAPAHAAPVQLLINTQPTAPPEDRHAAAAPANAAPPEDCYAAAAPACATPVQLLINPEPTVPLEARHTQLHQPAQHQFNF